MSLSKVTYPGGASSYAITFPYLAREHVSVFVDDVFKATSTWFFLDATHIALSPNPDSSHVVKIRRFTPLDDSLVEFRAPVATPDLTTARLQTLFAVQEFMEEPYVQASEVAGLEDLLTGAALQDTLGLFVRMVCTDNTYNAWRVYKPDGSLLNIAGTTTMGYQEACAYALSEGYPLLVGAKGEKGPAGHGTPCYIDCSTPVVWPPAQIGCIIHYNVSLNFGPTDLPYGLLVDSAQNVFVQWLGGQIVYSGPGSAVIFNPRNNVPIDGFAAIDASNFQFCAICCFKAGSDACVRFTCANGSIIGNKFSFEELNGSEVPGTGRAKYGILVDDPPTDKGFVENYIEARTVHLMSDAGLQLCTHAAGFPQNARNNEWHVMGIHPAGPDAHGVDTFSGGDRFYIGAITAQESALGQPPTVGIKLQSTAAGVTVECGDLSQCVAPVTDLGPVNRVTYGGVTHSARFLHLEVLGDARVFGPSGSLGFSDRADNAKSYAIFNNLDVLNVNHYLNGNLLTLHKTGRFGRRVAGLLDFADDAAAAGGGLAIGDEYRTGSIMKTRIT